MKCPYCGEEMKKGFLMSSRDITFAIDNPDGNIFRIKKHGDLELRYVYKRQMYPCLQEYLRPL